MKNPHDHPFLEVAGNMEKLANAGGLCFQKYTCGGCGERLVMEPPNHVYKEGRCDCGHVTNIVESGCNFLLIGVGTPEFMAAYDAYRAGTLGETRGTTH